jgi:hypothetical protein
MIGGWGAGRSGPALLFTGLLLPPAAGSRPRFHRLRCSFCLLRPSGFRNIPEQTCISSSLTRCTNAQWLALRSNHVTLGDAMAGRRLLFRV